MSHNVVARVFGDTEAGVLDKNASFPVKVGGVARTTNPSALDDGDRISFSADDVGRPLITPIQVRDLLSTGAATLSTGTAATLTAAVSGVFKDLIHISFSNNSTVAGNTAAVQLLQDGTVIKNVQVPNGGSVQFSPPRPIPAQTANSIWSVDMEDITGTTVYVDALFSNEV